MHKRWAYFLLTVFILGAAIKEVYAKLVLNVLNPFPFTLITSVVAQITALGVVGARAGAAAGRAALGRAGVAAGDAAVPGDVWRAAV